MGGGARQALAGGHGVVEPRGEAPAAVHHRALLGQLLQDGPPPAAGDKTHAPRSHVTPQSDKITHRVKEPHTV